MAECLIFADGTSYERVPQKTLGPYRIATEIRKYGFSCQVVHLISWFTTNEIETVCKKFIDENTKIVGFSTTFFGTINPIKKTATAINDLDQKLDFLLAHIKKNYPHVKIIFGGPNGAILRNNGYYCDAVILGYGESAIIKMLQNKELIPVDMIEGTPVYNDSNSEFNFCDSTVEYQDWDCFDQDDTMVLEVARGCIFRCKFCAYPLNGKKKLDYLKDPDVLRNELIRNYEKFKVNKYIISDDTFNDSTEKLLILHKIFKSLPFRIYFSCYLRLDLLNAHREQIDLLLDMGLTGANFGIESFHPVAARTIGKGSVFKNAKQLLHELKTIHWKERVKIQVGLIVGLPHDTLKSLRETRDWILDPTNNIDKVNSSVLMVPDPSRDPFPWKSEFQLQAFKYGFYWPNPENPNDWKNMLGPIKHIEHARMINKELNDAILASKRDTFGGFSLFVSNPYFKYADDKKDFEEIISMDRFEFKLWNKKNKESSSRYVAEYKRKLFSL